MTSSAERVQLHRSRLRRHGLRPVQLWLPDTRRPGFAEECRRQSLALRDDPHEQVVSEWLEAVADDSGWHA
jgi:hypothetical protein